MTPLNFKTRSRLVCAIAALSTPLWTVPVRAATVEIPASRDNTLIETSDGSLSNGMGPGIFSGRTGQDADAVRRAVIAFDVARHVPPRSRITNVRLTLTVTGSGGDFTETINLHRLLADWGEGTSSTPSGSGEPSTPGDATWIHGSFDGTFWQTPGGDFEPAPSGTAVVGDEGIYTWGSAGRLIDDVRTWIDDPSRNFGWILLGNEDGRFLQGGFESRTVKRFGSRENRDPSTRPVLTVMFEPPRAFEIVPLEPPDPGNEPGRRLGTGGPIRTAPAGGT